MNKTLDNRAKGNIGEDIACNFLLKRGFTIVTRNYRKKWGEIDIIAEKDKTIHVFEVKSVTANLLDGFDNGHRPEEKVDFVKVRRLRRMIQTYMSENLSEKGRWQRGRQRATEEDFVFHVLCVFMDMSRRVARVRWIMNIIL
jgi:putative endonuclease